LCKASLDLPQVGPTLHQRLPELLHQVIEPAPYQLRLRRSHAARRCNQAPKSDLKPLPEIRGTVQVAAKLAELPERLLRAHRFRRPPGRFITSFPPRLTDSNRISDRTAFCAPATRDIARESARGFSGFRRRFATHRVPGAT
jgi:hypothetical protein